MENQALDDHDDEALMSLRVPMFISGDDNNTFRVRNKSLTDWERRIVVERLTKATEIRCLLLDVVHGRLSAKPDSPPATLMVFKFRFDPIKHGRRLIQARIDIEFFAKEAGGEAPTVLAIAADERWSVIPTVDHESWSAGGKLTAGVSGVPLTNLGGEASLQRTWAKDISDATTVTGGAHLGQGIDSGEPTACGWTLLENGTRNTGLPSSLTVAVLIERKTDKQFNAVVNLEARGNLRTRMDWMFSKIPVDDPVLFNPATAKSAPDGRVEDDDDEETDDEVDVQEEGEKEKGKGDVANEEASKGKKSRSKKITAKKYGTYRLGRWKTKMDSLSDVTFRTVYGSSEKERY